LYSKVAWLVAGRSEPGASLFLRASFLTVFQDPLGAGLPRVKPGSVETLHRASVVTREPRLAGLQGTFRNCTDDSLFLDAPLTFSRIALSAN
jgi:hypothetical protein